MQTSIILRYAIREALGLAVMAVALFWSAGQIDWWPAWASVGVMLSWTVAMAVAMVRFSPSLLAERLGPRKGAKKWDTTIMSILAVTQLVRYVVSGLDRRYNWTGAFPIGVQITGLVVGVLGYTMVTWAAASNTFFSQIVRIQSERCQTVVRKGPYRYVRHPAYAGAIVYELAVAVLLSSWWALLVGVLNCGLLVLRTALEDRTLQGELPGYREYSDQVRHRLVPGIWWIIGPSGHETHVWHDGHTVSARTEDTRL